MAEKIEITKELIESVLNGTDPTKHIIKLECSYEDDQVTIISRDDNGVKQTTHDPFYPFCWATQSVCKMMFKGHREKVKQELSEHGMACKKLRTTNLEGKEPQRMRDGYNVMFYAIRPISYQRFMDFFKKAGVPIYPKQNDLNYGRKDYMSVAPIEQYMIYTGKRMFKGYDDYDNLVRMNFDLETTGLDPLKETIDQIGVRTNKGFERILTVEGDTEAEKIESQFEKIKEFFEIIRDEDPDVISGYNTENFDWPFIDAQLKKVGTSLDELSSQYFRKNIFKEKKETVLKLGGEMEYYHKTIMYGTNITDGIHAVRRAMAQNSSIKKAGLKYITQYLKLNKDNRVYVPGELISETWNVLEPLYAFNDENGEWYKVTEEKPLKEGFKMTTGRYIVERYLLDDLYESEKVEYSYNIINFVVGKMLPVSFERACTMGTAGIWKYIMMAWSYQFGLAIPQLVESHPFTGGISRMLKCGRVDNVVKFDYNSLYPSIILSYGIKTDVDLLDAMPTLLDYLLTSREHFKGLKKQYEKKSDALREVLKGMDKKDPKYEETQHEFQEALGLYRVYDSTQAGNKVVCNGFFGSYGSGSVFPWSDLMCAEKTTCIGRQSLRLMIGFFHDLGYTPIVGDSVTYDTPVFVKDSSDKIDIKPICELFNDEESKEYEKEQFRDFSKKDYQVLTRSGWCDIKYVYKHKTDKTLRRIETKNGLIDCTEDHSLFDSNKNEIKPKDLKRGDSIEIYKDEINYQFDDTLTENKAWVYGFFMADGSSVYCDKKQKYFSKTKNEYVLHNGKRANWKISNKSLERLHKAEKILVEEFGVKCDIKDHLKSSNVYDLVVYETELSKLFSKLFYTSYRYKKVPTSIINSNKDIKKAFLDGFCCGDGQGDTINECIEFGQKSKVAMAGLYFILKELNYNFRCHNRHDKEEFISFRFRNHRGNLLNENYSTREENEVWNNSIIHSKDEYVYDISADGTFVDALGMIVCHNTDGFDLQMPDPSTYRYTKENPYIGTGESIGSKKGKEYANEWGDLLEFNDKYMRGRMFCDVDEYIQYGINCSRKNYLNYLENGEVKVVGNTLKSKKMPIYIEKFMQKAFKMLLLNQGKEFIEYYYEYLEKIYTYKIPLKDIATVGKIKTSIDDYKKKCKELTAAGTKRSRQAWYELAIKENLAVNMGDSIYYINVGNKKNDSDVKRVTKYYVNDIFGKTDMTKQYTKEYKLKIKNNPEYKETHNNDDFVRETYPDAEIVDEVIFNCYLLSNDVVESEEDHFCEEGYEYNVDKYIEMFNKRITPLLVCFKPEMRMTINEKGKEVSNILVTNPKDRKYFTEEECQLTNGFPFKESDQDTYEELMTMDDKEIHFWLSINEEPMFAKDMGMDWEQIKKDYNERQEILKQEGIKDEVEEFNRIVNNMSNIDVDNFLDGIVPAALNKICYEGKGNYFVSRKYNVKIGTFSDIIDRSVVETDDN